MKSHKKKIDFWLVFGCVFYLGYSILLSSNLIPLIDEVRATTSLSPASQSDYIPLPIYSVGDYWIYNESETHFFKYSDHTDTIWNSSGLTTKNITAIEQIYDYEGKKKECYVQKIKTDLIYHFYDGNISYKSIVEDEYLDTLTLECVEYASYVVYKGDPYFSSQTMSVWSNFTARQCRSMYNYSYPTFYPLKVEKKGKIYCTITYNHTYYVGEGCHNQTVTSYIDNYGFFMFSFSNLSTGLGTFSGIKVQVQDDLFWWNHYRYYSQNIGNYILEYSSTENDYPDPIIGLYEYMTQRKELIEYHFANPPNTQIGFEISGFPPLFIGTMWISVGFLYLILKRRLKITIPVVFLYGI